MAELHKTKEDLKQAKDEAMQSWLDSRPLIDELEKLQTGLESAKVRSNMSNSLIAKLESQLQNIHACIKAKKEDELKVRDTIEEITRASEKTREEMERFKLETDEERRTRSKLKQVLRLRKQTLRTLQLTLRAIRLESEAYGASAAEGLHHINRSQMENTVVHIPEDNYRSLTRRANEEASLAEWRVKVSMEQRLAAEESRDLALRRLNEEKSEKRSRKKKIMDEITDDRATEREEDSMIMVGAHISTRQIGSPKARARGITEAHQRYPTQQMRRARSNNRKKIVKKKKPSIFVQIRTFLVQKITRLFG